MWRVSQGRAVVNKPTKLVALSASDESAAATLTRVGAVAGEVVDRVEAAPPVEAGGAGF